MLATEQKIRNSRVSPSGAARLLVSIASVLFTWAVAGSMVTAQGVPVQSNLYRPSSSDSTIHRVESKNENLSTSQARTPLTNSRLAYLPTERTLADALPNSRTNEIPQTMEQEQRSFSESIPEQSLFQRMRPTFQLETEWLAPSQDVGLISYEATIQVPLFPVFGPPPPMIRFGLSQTELLKRGNYELPKHLSDYSLGVSWVRRLNDRWTLRMMSSAAFAGDGHNRSSDAWQFRGGLFAIYSRDPSWIWTVGVLALGRNDLPVVPALGLIWEPKESLKFELILPRPRVRALLVDGATRQQWVYVGGGFSGGTWAYQQTDGVDDQLTYGDWRLVAGWECVPRAKPGVPFQRGRKMSLETGYSFSRDFEFEGSYPKVPLNETLFVRAAIGF